MLHGSKVITLVEKKRKEVAWLGFELTTPQLEVQCANQLHHGNLHDELIFFKCHMVQVITFEPCNIFELIWYSEWPLAAELFLFGFWKNLGYQKVFFKTTDLYFFFTLGRFN